MNEIKNSLKKDFSTIPNALINADQLDPMSRFLFTYMASKSDDWQFFHKQLQKALHIKDPRTFRKYMAELLAAGWVSRERMRKDGAKFDSFNYTLHSHPVCKNSIVQNLHSAKIAHLTNKEPLTKEEPKYIYNKEPQKTETPPTPTPTLPPAERLVLESLLKAERFFETYPAQQQAMCERARRADALHPKVWRDTLEAWIRYNIDNPAVICHIETSITKSFQAWLTRNLEANNRPNGKFARPAETPPTQYNAPANKKLTF